MTDKDIIIDGVDVSKCRHFLKDTKGPDYSTDEYVKGCCEAKGCYIECEFIGYSICRGDKDCYYKQLQRKTAECEKHEQVEEKLVNQIKTICDFINNRSEIFKGINGDVNKIIIDYAEQKEQECEKYEQALDEIFNVLNTALMVKPPKTYDFVKESNILDIISKAKDGKNE